MPTRGLVGAVAETVKGHGLGASWQGYLVGLANQLADEVEFAPEGMSLLVARPDQVHGVWPPMSDLALVENFLVTLRDYGFSDEQAVQTYRAFFTFVMGYVLVQAAAGVGVQRCPGRDCEPLNERRYPTVARLRDQLGQARARVEFEMALEALLEQIEISRQADTAQLAASGRSRSSVSTADLGRSA